MKTSQCYQNHETFRFVWAVVLALMMISFRSFGTGDTEPPPCDLTNTCSGASYSITNMTVAPTNFCVGTTATATFTSKTVAGSDIITFADCHKQTNSVSPSILTNVWVATVGSYSETNIDTTTLSSSWPFAPTDCGDGTVSVTSYWLDGCNSTNVQSTGASATFKAVRVDIFETQIVSCTNQTVSFTLTNTCGGVTWEVSPSVAGGAQVNGGSIETGTNCATYTVTARSTNNTECTDTATLVVSKEEILSPIGSYGATVNPVSSWQSSAPYHFDFQGVRSNTPGVYSLMITGQVCPDSILGYSWTLSAAAGTLTGTNTATPTHYPPATAGSGALTLQATLNGTNIGCAATKSVIIYRDHLGRDKNNFGTGISCAGNWQFTAWGATITMSNTWNCHGGTKHAFDGSGNGSAQETPHFTSGWATVQVDGTDVLTYPFSSNVLAAINAMTRGDVVTYHCSAKDAAYGPGHSATSLGGAATWGANNAAMVSGPWREAWKFDQATVTSTAADLSAHWPLAFPTWTFDYIKIHKRP
jgi:hypothetical protein